MKHFSLFIIFVFFLLCALILMNSGVFRFFDINPNIILAFFVALIASRVRNSILIFSAFFLLFTISLFYEFWMLEYVLLIIVLLGCLLIRPRITGNVIWDSLILASLSTLFLSVLLWFFTHSPIIPILVSFEILYNALLSSILVLLLRPIAKRGSN